MKKYALLILGRMKIRVRNIYIYVRSDVHKLYFFFQFYRILLYCEKSNDLYKNTFFQMMYYTSYKYTQVDQFNIIYKSGACKTQLSTYIKFTWAVLYQLSYEPIFVLLLINNGMTDERYFMCSKCGTVVDSSGKAVDAKKLEIDIKSLSSTTCKICLDYQIWENNTYFSNDKNK